MTGCQCRWCRRVEMIRLYPDSQLKVHLDSCRWHMERFRQRPELDGDPLVGISRRETLDELVLLEQEAMSRGWWP